MSYANVPVGKRFVLLSTTVPTADFVLDANGAVDSATKGALRPAFAAGSVVIDMGKKVVLPNPASGAATTKVIRKVKLSNGVNGNGTEANNYATFYIDVTGPASNWASLNV